MKERLFYFDILRAFAILGVIFIHVNGLGYSSDKHSVNYNLSILIRQFVNFSVPLFLFVSGYFMSKKVIKNKIEYFEYIKKQLPRVLLPFLVWSIFYSIISYVQGNDLFYVLKRMVIFQASVPFYFILLIIQYYIIQPLVVKMGETKSFVLVALFISLLSCFVIETLRYLFDINISLVLYAGNFLTWLIFPVLGAYVQKNEIQVKPIYLLLFSMALLIISVFHSLYLINGFDNPNEAVTAIKVSSFLYSISIILFLYSVRKTFIKHPLLIDIGLTSFGIYFSHMFFIMIINKVMELVGLNTDMLVLQLLITASALALSYLLGKLLQKVNLKLTNKYLGF